MNTIPSDQAAAARGCPVVHGALSEFKTPTGCPVSQRAADFDPFSDGYQQDPPEYVRWAREQEPVFYNPQLGYWVVTRYEDVKAIFRDNITFSPSIALEKITPSSQEANAVLASYGYDLGRTMVNEDEPAHMPRRRALMEPFTPQALAQLEPRVRQLTRGFVDRFIDSGRADLVDQMLWELPLTVGMLFMGVPEDDMQALHKYSVAHTVNTWGRPTPQQQVAVAHAVGNFWQHSLKVLDKLRASPEGPGWMQYSIRQAQKTPDVVPESYLRGIMMAGIVASHETTSFGATNAVKLLLQHPNVWRELCEDPSLIPNAVEECLRHNGSIAAWRRLATRDVVVGGQAIPAGAKLLIVSSSANHDQGHFADADLFDIHRDNASDHLTFGYGGHQCMGKNLARMEIQIILEELTRRLPHMQLAEQAFDYTPNTSFRGPKHLWVQWDPALNPERRDPAILQKHQALRIGESSTGTATGRTLVVERAERLADGVLHLRLAALPGSTLPRWTPGSHIDVACGDTGLSRQYSLCGDPADANVFEIAVLRDPGSRGGSDWVHAQVKVGDRLRVRGPRNHFRLDESAGRYVFVAGGIGITPVMAMARCARALGKPYELHYCGRRREGMAFIAQLQALHGEQLHLHVSSEGSRLDLQALLASPEAGTQVYACGPLPMLQGLQDACAHWPEDALHVEHFESTLGTLDPSKEQAFEVELKDSGLTLNVRADQTLLSALRAANIDVQSDCEEGLCGSCEVRVLHGPVEHRDMVLTRSEREAGQRMMSCCSRACGGEKLVLAL